MPEWKSPVEVVWKTSKEAGSCNFCTRRSHRVWELRSKDPDRRLVVMICEDCRDEFARQSRPRFKRSRRKEEAHTFEKGCPVKDCAICRGIDKAMREKLDTMRSIASEMFGVPYEKVTDDERGEAKTIAYGHMYGSWRTKP